MVYKTKQNYYTLENRVDHKEVKLKKIKHRGYKVVVKGLAFYCENNEWIPQITDGITGTFIKLPRWAKDLETVEKMIIANFDLYTNQIKKRMEEHPEWNLELLEEGEK